MMSNLDPEFYVKRNRATRKRLSAWVSEFSKYETFAEGCGLLLDYYDTEDTLKRDYWALHEMLMRWNSCISISLYYGNAYQIASFVPFANKIVTDIVTEMVKCKSKAADKTKVERPKNFALDAKQVKIDIDSMRVFGHYFPEISKSRSSVKKAHCPSGKHADQNPSLSVYADGHVHCFSCGYNKDVFGLVMHLENVDFATAISRVWELGR